MRFTIASITSLAGAAAAAAALVSIAPPASAADPVCKAGEESIGGKCLSPCKAGFVRAPDSLQCVVQAPVVKKPR